MHLIKMVLDLLVGNSIVGGGNNSCILHYVENNSELIDGDLVLVDAGCEYHTMPLTLLELFQ